MTGKSKDDILGSSITTCSNSRWYHLPIYDLSYMWYSGVACMLVMVIGMVVSLVDNSQFAPVDPDLLASGVESFFCCFPRRVKQWMAIRKVFASQKYDIEM